MNKSIALNVCIKIRLLVYTCITSICILQYCSCQVWARCLKLFYYTS